MRRLAVLAILVACGEDDIGIDSYRDELIDAQCSYLLRCGLFASSADCRGYFGPRFLDDPNPEAAVAAGKVEYDGAAARHCADAVASASCDGTSETARVPDESCQRIFKGSTPAGESCTFSYECESQSCLMSSCTMACCTGTCGPPRTPAPIGQSCANVACAAGGYCHTDGTCHELLPGGAICDAGDQCVYGLGCFTQGATGVCTAMPKLGEPCPDYQCRDVGAVCSTGMCKPAGLPGSTCAADNDCSSYYMCGADQRCRPYATRGEACSFLCSDNSWCSNGLCVEQKQNGSPCLRNDECVTYFCQRFSGAVTGNCADIPVCF